MSVEPICLGVSGTNWTGILSDSNMPVLCGGCGGSVVDL